MWIMMPLTGDCSITCKNGRCLCKRIYWSVWVLLLCLPFIGQGRVGHLSTALHKRISTNFSVTII